jgi:excinuclease UvrABC ATPase subunit
LNDIIEINGASTNNLKHITVHIPKHQITIVTGVSGSGKSSLVFSTLAAESQRLINKTYSSYIQQLMPHFPQPLVDKISNLPVSIVVDQKKIVGNSRSTVGTATDVYTGLRLLFSRLAKPFIGYSMVYSFNNPLGMCPQCKGIGKLSQIDSTSLLDRNKSLNEGAVKFPTFQPGGWRLTRYTESGYFDNDLPLKNWTKEDLDLLLNGAEHFPKNPSKNWHKTAKYIGLIPRIKTSFVTKESDTYTQDVQRVSSTTVCPACNGLRVNEKVRSAKINGYSIADCSAMSLNALYNFLKDLHESNVTIIVQDLLEKIKSLATVGLNYLTLNRETGTLSGGESQRLKLANYLTSPLSDILYIFDEPSVGLHPHDLIGINHIFKRLRDQGNTVVIVDHDPDVIKIADYIINLGEHAGAQGGQVTYTGTYSGLLVSDTITGRALANKGLLNLKQKKFDNFYKLNHVSLFNVHDASIKIPKDGLTVVTGVAGSGKSTLIRRLLVKHYPQSIVLDQSGIYASNRSNILTYLAAFDALREGFSKVSHKPVSLFSFNGKGACPHCKGKGVVKLDLAYMGDTFETCDACHGSRYNSQALAERWHGLTIAEVLNLTVSEASQIFHTERLNQVLQNLLKANLGYVKLGQSLDSFSGGERQRLKLAKLLGESSNQILILDEPSSGLHENDCEGLLGLFHRLVKDGYTVIVLEHNLRIMGQADWLIDMGPLAGSQGGQILFQGYVIDLVNQGNGFTAEHLRRYYLH